MLLKNKKILFIAPSFFSYEQKIAKKMTDLGAQVDFYDERSITNYYSKALLKIYPQIFYKKSNEYYNVILKKIFANNYDYVFVIKCEMMPTEIIIKMKNLFRNAIFCLYLYDSLKNIKDISNKLRYFDRVFSFDRIDAENHKNIIFRPLFFLDEYRRTKVCPTENEYQFDLSFLGTIHSDRFAIIKEIRKICDDWGLKFFSFQYLQSGFMYYCYKILKNEFRETSKNDFNYEKLESVNIAEIVDKSKVILDIQHPQQTGLTMRTIEMIGMNKKLITTNQDIKNYDFYDPYNILVIDRKNIKIPKEFFDAEYRPIDEKIYEKYYIESWINDILH